VRSLGWKNHVALGTFSDLLDVSLQSARSYPGLENLYRLLKKAEDKFLWNKQADEAFEALKKMLSTAPILAAPLP
jgi:hypothetical protein